MKKIYVWAIVLIIIVLGAVWYFDRSPVASSTQQSPTAQAAPDQGLGTYNYECDEHVTFSMSPASDMSSITIAPTGASTYPPAVTLTKQQATSGALYTGGGVVFTAHGETVTLGQGDSAINCSPVQDPNNAPFNFGD